MADRALEVRFSAERKALVFITASRLSMDLRELSDH
jgi:hypothetical protein